MILYRKGAPLRIRRAPAPEPPFFAATSVAPYGARRSAPVAIDYLARRASAADKLEVAVCANVRDELERARAIAAPVVVDAAEAAEVVFRRGEEILAFCEETGREAIELISTRGSLPRRAYERAACAIAAWPLELAPLERMFAEAQERRLRWGVIVPVVFPVTTVLEPLESLADLARTYGAAFLAAMTLDVDATARQALARSLELDADDDRYAMLFHASVEPIHTATERHLAALAQERGLSDFVVPPAWQRRSNWNAATLLTLTATRMLAMELDLDLAGRIARSARVVAELDKPLELVASSASLSIIGGLDETSVEMLTEWLEGNTPSFAEFVNEQWRTRRV